MSLMQNLGGKNTSFGSQRCLDFGNAGKRLRTCIIIPTLQTKSMASVGGKVFYKRQSGQGSQSVVFGSLTVTLIFFVYSHSINYGVRSAKISKYGYGFFLLLLCFMYLKHPLL